VFTNFVGDENGTLVDLPRDATYSVVEISTPSDYTVSYSADCTGTILATDFKTCTVTNDDITAKLLVKKHVINDSGRGTQSAGSFRIRVDVDGGFFTDFLGDETGTLLNLPRDATYSVIEPSRSEEHTSELYSR